MEQKGKKSLFAKSENLPKIQKEVENFLDECEKVMGTLATKLWIHHLSSFQKSTDLVFP